MTTVRPLREGETPPPGEPKRYNTPPGYTTLRWKIRPGEYVQTLLRDEDGRLVRDRPYKKEPKTVDANLAVGLYESGLSLSQVARRLECDDGHLSRLLRRRGVKMRTGADYRPVLDIEFARRRYVIDGASTDEIANETGIARTKVRSELRKLGVLRGARGSRRRHRTYRAEFEKTRAVVFERAGGLCEIRAHERCVGSGSHVHHRRTRSQGGNNSPENLALCCVYCHAFIHAHPALSYQRGWLIRGNVVTVPERP